MGFLVKPASRRGIAAVAVDAVVVFVSNHGVELIAALVLIH